MRQLTLVIFLLLVSVPPLQAQTSYYQGKTMTIVVGTVAGDLYDLYARAIGSVYGKIHSRKSQHHRAKHAGRRTHDCGQLYLQCR